MENQVKDTVAKGWTYWAKLQVATLEAGYNYAMKHNEDDDVPHNIDLFHLQMTVALKCAEFYDGKPQDKIDKMTQADRRTLLETISHSLARAALLLREYTKQNVEDYYRELERVEDDYRQSWINSSILWKNEEGGVK